MKTRSLVIVTLLAVLGAATAHAQTILPNAAGGWASSGPSPSIPPAQLATIAGAQAGVLREFGVTSAEQRQYANGSQTATLTLYRMIDPSAAYGAFTFLRDVQMGDIDLGDSAAFSAATPEKAVFVVGNLLVMASGSPQRPPDAALSDLAAALLRSADRRPFPTITGYIPRRSAAPKSGNGKPQPVPAATRLNIIPLSEHYVLGPQALKAALGNYYPATGDDWLGFGSSTEAVTAQYRTPGGSQEDGVTLLVAIYPTQQLAASHFDTLNKWIALNVEPGQSGGRPIVYGLRSSALVALAFGAPSREIASGLIDQIQYHSLVTWNEPSQSFSDPPFSVMMIGVFEGTGLIMLLAFVVGLGFGGFRMLTKLIFPGKVFDRRSQVEILQLGLSSKPIDSQDLY